MSKKMKLNLDELKVQSFVTDLSKETKNNIFGGVAPASSPEAAQGSPNTCVPQSDPKPQ